MCVILKKAINKEKKGRKRSDRKEVPGKDQRTQRNLRDQKRRILWRKQQAKKKKCPLPTTTAV